MDGTGSSPQELLARWRAGEAVAGARLAERCTLWYRAVCLARLGPVEGREAFQRACGRFQQGVSGVLPPQFAAWSHGIVAEEVARQGARLRTTGPEDAAAQARGEALREAARALTMEDVRLLHLIYGGTASGDTPRGSAARGSMPGALIEARDALKAALARSGAGAFALAGVQPDHAPLAFFEAGRTSAEEDSAIEGWLSEDAEACQDLVDMAPWALALRAGALAPLLEERTTPAPSAPREETAPVSAAAAPSGRAIRWDAPPKAGIPGWVWGAAVVALGALAAWGWMRG
jgi:hypothetical protein